MFRDCGFVLVVFSAYLLLSHAEVTDTRPITTSSKYPIVYPSNVSPSKHIIGFLTNTTETHFQEQIQTSYYHHSEPYTLNMYQHKYTCVSPRMFDPLAFTIDSAQRMCYAPSVFSTLPTEVQTDRTDVFAFFKYLNPAITSYKQFEHVQFGPKETSQTSIYSPMYFLEDTNTMKMVNENSFIVRDVPSIPPQPSVVYPTLPDLTGTVYKQEKQVYRPNIVNEQDQNYLATVKLNEERNMWYRHPFSIALEGFEVEVGPQEVRAQVVQDLLLLAQGNSTFCVTKEEFTVCPGESISQDMKYMQQDTSPGTTEKSVFIKKYTIQPPAQLQASPKPVPESAMMEEEDFLGVTAGMEEVTITPTTGLLEVFIGESKDAEMTVAYNRTSSVSPYHPYLGSKPDQQAGYIVYALTRYLVDPMTVDMDDYGSSMPVEKDTDPRKYTLPERRLPGLDKMVEEVSKHVRGTTTDNFQKKMSPLQTEKQYKQLLSTPEKLHALADSCRVMSALCISFIQKFALLPLQMKAYEHNAELFIEKDGHLQQKSWLFNPTLHTFVQNMPIIMDHLATHLKKQITNPKIQLKLKLGFVSVSPATKHSTSMSSYMPIAPLETLHAAKIQKDIAQKYRCLLFYTNGWWVYRQCLNHYVGQFHVDSVDNPVHVAQVDARAKLTAMQSAAASIGGDASTMQAMTIDQQDVEANTEEELLALVIRQVTQNIPDGIDIKDVIAQLKPHMKPMLAEKQRKQLQRKAEAEAKSKEPKVEKQDPYVIKVQYYLGFQNQYAFNGTSNTHTEVIPRTSAADIARTLIPVKANENTHFVQEYLGGSVCGAAQDIPRYTQVRYFCTREHTTPRILEVREVSACTYVVDVAVPELCESALFEDEKVVISETVCMKQEEIPQKLRYTHKKSLFL